MQVTKQQESTRKWYMYCDVQILCHVTKAMVRYGLLGTWEYTRMHHYLSSHGGYLQIAEMF